jgi:hypothetical protein
MSWDPLVQWWDSTSLCSSYNYNEKEALQQLQQQQRQQRNVEAPSQQQPKVAP